MGRAGFPTGGMPKSGRRGVQIFPGHRSLTCSGAVSRWSHDAPLLLGCLNLQKMLMHLVPKLVV